MGEGGVGVFVGGGGRFKSSGSTNEYSDVLVEGRCSLEWVNDDSDVGEESKDESLLNGSIVAGVIVSARWRGTNRPSKFLGCDFQASVEDVGGGM